MPTRRVISAVVHNALASFVSRYSDYRGYWLFGFLVGGLNHPLELDLLHGDPHRTDSEAVAFARELAARRFAEQIAKQRGSIAHVREARLTIERLPDEVEGPVNSQPCKGWRVRCVAAAITDRGIEFRDERVVFVAPHDPEWERNRYGPPDPRFHP